MSLFINFFPEYENKMLVLRSIASYLTNKSEISVPYGQCSLKNCPKHCVILKQFCRTGILFKLAVNCQLLYAVDFPWLATPEPLIPELHSFRQFKHPYDLTDFFSPPKNLVYFPVKVNKPEKFGDGTLVFLQSLESTYPNIIDAINAVTNTNIDKVRDDLSYFLSFLIQFIEIARPLDLLLSEAADSEQRRKLLQTLIRMSKRGEQNKGRAVLQLLAIEGFKHHEENEENEENEEIRRQNKLNKAFRRQIVFLLTMAAAHPDKDNTLIQVLKMIVQHQEQLAHFFNTSPTLFLLVAIHTSKKFNNSPAPSVSGQQVILIEYLYRWLSQLPAPSKELELSCSLEELHELSYSLAELLLCLLLSRSPFLYLLRINPWQPQPGISEDLAPLFQVIITLVRAQLMTPDEAGSLMFQLWTTPAVIHFFYDLNLRFLNSQDRHSLERLRNFCKWLNSYGGPALNELLNQIPAWLNHVFFNTLEQLVDRSPGDSPVQEPGKTDLFCFKHYRCWARKLLLEYDELFSYIPEADLEKNLIRFCSQLPPGSPQNEASSKSLLDKIKPTRSPSAGSTCKPESTENHPLLSEAKSDNAVCLADAVIPIPHLSPGVEEEPATERENLLEELLLEANIKLSQSEPFNQKVIISKLTDLGLMIHHPENILQVVLLVAKLLLQGKHVFITRINQNGEPVMIELYYIRERERVRIQTEAGISYTAFMYFLESMANYNLKVDILASK